MKNYQVQPGQPITLEDLDPGDTSVFSGDKEAARHELKELVDQLSDLQEILYAQGKHKILVVLQAMDTGGKDGAIRNVFGEINPQGVRVENFKVPTPEELAHDYLWRVHKVVPKQGMITVFNRSHYEDVLVVRVKNLVPPEVWEKRYDQINDFERMLAETGTTILKFFLHISRDEQKERLQARLDNPLKHWKFNPKDLDDRALWSEYLEAYEDVVNRTSTEWAPWIIVPADRKWYRNVVIASYVVVGRSPRGRALERHQHRRSQR